MKSFIYEICRWAAVAATILMLMSMGSQQTVSDADPDKVLEAVCQCADMTNMQPASNQIVKRLYGIDPSDYEFCALYYPLTNMDVDELLLVKYADSSQADQVQSAVESRLTGQKNAFESYGVGQMELLSNHSFSESRSGYSIFAVNTKSDDVRNAFIAALKGE